VECDVQGREALGIQRAAASYPGAS